MHCMDAYLCVHKDEKNLKCSYYKYEALTHSPIYSYHFPNIVRYFCFTAS